MPDPIIGPIKLTPEEEAIWVNITLDHQDPGYDHARNTDLVVRLMRLIHGRRAIPESRWKYFTEPIYRTGRRKGSVRDMLERNSHDTGEEIYRLPGFLQYLRYFVCGAQLPPVIVDRFRRRAFALGHVSGSDAAELGQFAKKLLREHGLASQNAAEEFYKLALDCGIYHSWAMSIREVLKKVR